MSEWRTRRTRRFKSEINVVPYIDVMLVLLIIFMVAAPLIAPTVINIPSVAMRANTPPALPIEILLRSEAGPLELIDRASRQNLGQMPRAQAVALLKTTQADRPVVISADKNVRYDVVIKLLGELNQQGVKRVGLSVLTTQ